MKNVFTNIFIYSFGFGLIFSQCQYVGIKEWCIITVGGCILILGGINLANQNN